MGDVCSFECAAPAPGLATCETEPLESWVRVELDPIGDSWLDGPWLPIELEPPELWLLAEFDDDAEEEAEDALDPPE